MTKFWSGFEKQAIAMKAKPNYYSDLIRQMKDTARSKVLPAASQVTKPVSTTAKSAVSGVTPPGMWRRALASS